MKMMKKLTNQLGISLVEILTAIVVIGIISSLLFSITLNGQDKYTKQANKNTELRNFSYSLKTFTKDIRKAQKVVKIDNTSIKINDSILYEFNEDTGIVTKAGVDYLSNVTDFDIDSTSVNGEDLVTKIDISLKDSKSDVSTSIVVRSGSK